MDNLHAGASKSPAIAKGRNKELALKLATANRDRMSVKAGLRSVESQVKEQRQRLHYTKIELATAKQQVLKLKTELSKAKEAAQVA